jgi:2-dehydropantoate 2-reductase
VRGRIHVGLPPGERYDFILLATQPPQVEAAARGALGHLAPGGHLVCFQNGLCELRLADIAGADRVIGAVVAWGASMPEPGLYDRTASGGFTLGRIAEADGHRGDPAVARLAQLLEAVGPVAVTSNLLGVRWSKLALNCAISSLGTIAGEALGGLIRIRAFRRLGLEIMTETVAVARAEGVRLEKVAGTLDLEWIALTEAEQRSRAGSPALAAKHALLLAVGMRYRRLRSSMLAAIERGRTPAVDFLNGEVAARGARRGVATPVNARVAELVWQIARGERAPGRALLQELHQQTR